MKVLIADDEPVSRRLLESSLTRWGYEVMIAEDGHQARKILCRSDAPQLVVLDWMMPGVDGVELCRELRRRTHAPYTYILLLTGKRDTRDIVEGLEAGADDYIAKPFEPRELKVRLRAGKRILCLQDQLVAARDALRDMAMRDSLTGLWNRATAIDLLSTEIARSDRQGLAACVILADVDHFKAINDTYGHAVGDAVLCAVAERLRKSVRPYDVVGRYGGEEFLLVLPGCDRLTTVSHAERLRAAISRLEVETPAGTLRVSMSAGVTVSDETSDAYALIHAADLALYRAKREGRNRVEFLEAKSARRELENAAG